MQGTLIAGSARTGGVVATFGTLLPILIREAWAAAQEAEEDGRCEQLLLRAYAATTHHSSVRGEMTVTFLGLLGLSPTVKRPKGFNISRGYNSDWRAC
jgi:hypothetical protein